MRMKFALKHSIPFLLFVFLCASAVVHLWMTVYGGYALALKEAEAYADLQSKTLVNLVQHMLEREDLLGVEKKISWVASDPNIENIFIVDDSNNVIFAMDYQFKGRKIRQILDDVSYGVISEVRRSNLHAARVDAKRHMLWNAFPIDLPPRPGELRSLRSGVLFLKHDYSRIARLELVRGLKEFYALMAFLVILCAGLWLVLRVRLVARLEKIVDATRRFAAGDLSARADVGGADELAYTGRAFNEMAERIEESTRTIIKKGEERFELALRGADLGLWDWEITTGAMYFNPRWAEMLGYSREDLKHHVSAWENLIHPDDRPEFMKNMQMCREGRGKTCQSEFRMQSRTGKWVWVYASGRVMDWDEENRPLRMLGTTLDITERKAWEKARENMIAKLQEALENVKTLKGLVPVCAWCHKVRDDQGYWKELTSYIQDHTEADISHGICPACASRERLERQVKEDQAGTKENGPDSA